MSEEDVNIRIKRDTWKRLHSRKEPNDSFDDVINRVLNKAEELEESEGNPSEAAPSSAD